MDEDDRNYDEMNEALAGVGFEVTDSPGKYTHNLFKGSVFDFTALSIEGAMTEVFRHGQRAGVASIRKSLKMVIFGVDNKY